MKHLIFEHCRKGLARLQLLDFKIYNSEPVRLLVQNFDESHKPLQAPYSSRQVQIICLPYFAYNNTIHSDQDKGVCESYTFNHKIIWNRQIPLFEAGRNLEKSFCRGFFFLLSFFIFFFGLVLFLSFVFLLISVLP